jgi:integrator complex subunit 9
MLDCSLNMKSLQYFIPQLLVPTQRFDHIPDWRATAPNGQVLHNIKEFNNRFFINSSVEFSLPQFNLINIEDIDAILISNQNTMLALPFLTKMKGFRATVYCTEPVMHFGRMLMEELTYFIKNNQSISIKSDNSFETSKISSLLFDVFLVMFNL